MLDSGIRAGHLNRSDDARISTAAADIAFERAADFGFGGLRRLLEQADTRQDHAGRAVAALHGVRFDEGFLQGVQLPVLREALNGCDLFPSDRGNAYEAGPDGSSVNQDGAGAALTFAAA